MGSFSVAIESGSILFREGLEAMLVVAALAAFLRRAGAHEHVRWLHVGAGLAIVASVIAAVMFSIFLNGVHDDRIEAAVMAAAAVLLLYMSGWMFVRQDPRAWKAELQQAAAKALDTGTVLSLGAVAFLAVFREGAETVLFLHALATSSGGWSVGLTIGIIVAAGALVVLYIAMQKLAVSVPLRPLFLVTSAFLFVMGLKFIGGAIQELQEQLVVPVHPADIPQWAIDLGMNASWEAIGAQLVVGAIAILSTLGCFRLLHRTPTSKAP